MDGATLTPPRPAHPLTGRPARAVRSRRRRRATDGARGTTYHRSALVLLLIVTLLLRLWGIKQGLPYSYNVDEATHFVPRAVAFFSHDLNPHYFLNPPAYSYLLHVVFELWFGSADAVTRAYTANPTEVFVVARVLAAVLGTLSVLGVYLAGSRLFDRDVGLFAAAIFGLAFLPIFYSHLALNDVPTLAPVALSLYGIAGVLRQGRTRDYLLAGLGIGLAAATKYTGGITFLCLLAAFLADAHRGSELRAVRALLAAMAVALVAFLIANPYAVLDFSAFTAGLGSQASLAAGADPVKLGTTAGGGIFYYLWTFTWGLGIGPTLAAIGGGVILLARRHWATALVLLPAPAVFVVFMGTQQRYFGRWLMPVFPIAALVAGYGAVELVRWMAGSRRVQIGIASGLVAVLLLTQSLLAAIHDDQVLSRPDTRNLTRAWMVAHVPAGAKVVIEPVVPDTWASDIGGSLPWTATGERWYRYPTWLSKLDANGNALPYGQRRYVVVDEYERALQPSLLDAYEKAGYCWIVIGSLQAGRAFSAPSAAPGAIAYYAALATRARLLYHVTPFSRGAHPVPFGFDWSIDYYPRQYRRPGPEMSVYLLDGGRCAAWKSAVLTP